MVTYEKQERPWGSWQVVYHAPDVTIKIMIINPGCMLSLQSHALRREEWSVASGECIAYTCGTDKVQTDAGATHLGVGSTYYLDKNMGHRLINPTAEPVVIVETIRGVYDEDDIVRLHDNYGRQ